MMVAAYVFLALAVMSYVFTPLFRPQGQLDARSRRADRLRQLREERERVYTSIRDLDFDYRTGKIEEDDYRSSRQELTGQAVEVLKQLDDASPKAAHLEDQLEKEIAAARKAPSDSQKGPSDSQKGPSDSQKAPDQANFCASCGAKIPADARFCPSCGKAIATA